MIGISVWFHLATGTLPISFTRSYTVYLKDKDTGQPISGAIAEGDWHAEKLSLHPNSKTYTRAYVMSDENGKIHIPWKLGIHLYSYYKGFSVRFRHPFYDSAGVGYSSGMPYLNDANGKSENEKWWRRPVEMRDLAKKYADAKCVATEGQYGVTNLNCTGHGQTIGSLMPIANHYFELIKSKKIRHYKREFHPNRQQVADKIRSIVTFVFSESDFKPRWVKDLSWIER